MGARSLRGSLRVLVVAGVLAACGWGVWAWVGGASARASASGGVPAALPAGLPSLRAQAVINLVAQLLSDRQNRPAVSMASPALAPYGLTTSHEITQGITGAGPGDLTAGSMVSGLSTADSRTYQTRSGAYLTRVYTQPVNYRNTHGAWAPIDDNLVSAGSGAVNAANSYRVSLPRDLSGGVTMSDGAGSVRWVLKGASGRGVLSGSTDTFSGALAGASVSYTAGATAVKEAIKLTSTRSLDALSFDVYLSAGLVPQRVTGNRVAFMAGGIARFGMPQPVMFGHDRGGAPVSAPVPFSLEKAVGHWVFALEPSRAWVAEHLAYGPVVIDPTTTQGLTPICYIDSNNPTTSYCSSTSEEVGDYSGAQQRTLLQWTCGSNPCLPQDANILNAQLAMYETGTLNQTAQKLAVEPVYDSWTSATTWNTRNGTTNWNNPGGDYDSQYAITETIPTTAGWVYFYPTQIMQRLIDNQLANHGIGVLTASTVYGSGNVYSFSNSGSTAPVLNVTWLPRAGNEAGYALSSQQLTDRLSASVNVANGNLLLGAADLHINGANGMDLQSTRFYNSLLAESPTGYIGSYGSGGTSTLGRDNYLQLFADGSIALDPGDGSAYIFYPNGSGIWQNPYGLHADLTQSGSNYVVSFHDTGILETYSTSVSNINGEAFLIEEQDRYGNPITLSYSSGNLISVKDTEGRTLNVSPSGSLMGTMTDWQTPTARKWQYAYTGGSADELQTYTDPALNQTKYGYDSSGRIDSITTPAGNVTLINYDAHGRVGSIVRTTNTGHTTGPTTNFLYNYAGPCPSSAGTNPVLPVADTRVEDPDYGTVTGHYVDYCTNSWDQLVETIDSSGHIDTGSYDKFGNLTETTQGAPGNAITDYDYDTTAGQQLKCAIADLATGGATCTNGTGNGVETDYDYNNNTTGGVVTGLAGLPYYQATDTVDSQDNQTNACYWGVSTNSHAATPPPGACTTNSSEPIGTLQNEWTKDGPSTPMGFTYGKSSNGNAAGLIQTSTDANGNTTNYGYTPNGDPQTVTPPTVTSGTQQGAKTTTYDSLSRPSTVTDGNGNVATYGYDNLDRILQVAYTHSGKPTVTVSYTYDADGNIKKRVDPQGTTNYTVDDLNRLTAESGPGGLNNTYTYDAASHLIAFADASASLTCPGMSTQSTVCYTVNGLNLTYKVQDASGTINLAYDNNNRLTQIQYPSLASVNYTYEPNSTQVKDVETEGPTGSELANYQYTYTAPTGSTTGLIQTAQVTLNNSTDTYTYDYDALNRLSIAQDSNDNYYYYYAYDNDGNICYADAVYNGQNNGGGPSTGYNQDNELLDTNGTGGSCQATGGTPTSYDAAGNETSTTNGIGSFTPSYSFTLGYNTAEQTTDDHQTSPNNTDYPQAYLGTGQDDLTQFAGGTAINNLTGVGSITNAGHTTYVTHMPTGTLLDERTSSGTYDYAFDAQGDVIGLLDANGNLVTTYTYDPYGNLINTAGSNPNAPNNFGFQSGLKTADGLYHFGQRYYDPSYERWSQTDPIPQPLDPVQGDSYTFASDDPVNAADPTGEWCFLRCAINILHNVLSGAGGEVAAGVVAIGVSGAQALVCGVGAAAITGVEPELGPDVLPPGVHCLIAASHGIVAGGILIGEGVFGNK